MKKNWLAIVGLVAASLVGIPSAAHATTTINITMSCSVSSARDQYVEGGYTLVYTFPTGCTNIGMNWPQGTSYSLMSGGTVVSSGTTANPAGGPTFTISSSNSYELTITLPSTIPSSFVTNSMHPSSCTSVSGCGKSGTNGIFPSSGGMGSVVYFVTDPSLSAGTSSGSTPSSVPASLSASIKPTATLDGSSIKCTSGSWNYSAGTTTRSGSETTTYLYSLEQDGAVVATAAKAVTDASYTFTNALAAGSTYSCSVEAKQYNATGTSSSLSNVSKLASLKRAIVDAKHAAKVAYFADVRTARNERAAAVQAMTTAIITNHKTNKVDRDAQWAKIRATYEAAQKAAKATETAANAAALAAFAKTVADAKGAVVAGVK